MRKKQQFQKNFVSGHIRLLFIIHTFYPLVFASRESRGLTHHLRCVYTTHAQLYAHLGGDQYHKKKYVFFQFFRYQTKNEEHVHFYYDKQFNFLLSYKGHQTNLEHAWQCVTKLRYHTPRLYNGASPNNLPQPSHHKLKLIA